MKPVGLIAGAGEFPMTFARKAVASGRPVICIGLHGMADASLAGHCTEYYRLKRLSLSFIMRTLRSRGVSEWTMAGKFHKHMLFRPWMWLRLLPDRQAARFWLNRRRRDNKDDTLLLGLIEEFRKSGLECVSALDLCPELLVKEGVLTRIAPTPTQTADIEFGWTLAREMGRLDVGQSVMIRKRAVLAIEAIEGTDLAIRRAGELCGRNSFVVVKVAKPMQDMRFDVPTVGPQTIETMQAAGAKVLAIEAGKTILLDEVRTLALADRHGICIIALSHGSSIA